MLDVEGERRCLSERAGCGPTPRAGLPSSATPAERTSRPEPRPPRLRSGESRAVPAPHGWRGLCRVGAASPC